MTANKPEPEVVALVDSNRSSGILFVSVNGSERPPTGTPLIRLSDYRELQRAAEELANWCCNGVGADPDVTPGLAKVMELTGAEYDY